MHSYDGRGLEGALEKNSKGGRIGNALPQEWKLKGGKIERFFRWPNSHGRSVQVEKFSRVKIFQKQFQCSLFQVGLPLDGFRLEFSLMKFAKLIVQCLKV